MPALTAGEIATFKVPTDNEMAESHARDSRIENANRDLLAAMDARLKLGGLNAAVEGMLTTAHEKLKEESARIVQRWD